MYARFLPYRFKVPPELVKTAAGLGPSSRVRFLTQDTDSAHSIASDTQDALQDYQSYVAHDHIATLSLTISSETSSSILVGPRPALHLWKNKTVMG